MSYDEQLTTRVREALKGQKMVAEKKMFGGLTFMVNGKMCIGNFYKFNFLGSRPR